jgi:putative redox protein
VSYARHRLGRYILMSGAASIQRLVWRGGLLFEGEDSWGHRVAISGEQASDGAKPSDLLPLSLAACLSYDVVEVLRKKRQALDTLEVTVRSEQEDESPRRFVRIALRFEVGGDVDPVAARRALELAEKHCPVLATVAPTVEVETAIEVTPPS